MLSDRYRALSCVAILLVVLALGLAAHKPPDDFAPPPGDGQVHLAVLLVFDQLRGDYLERWHDLFVPDGFRRLTDEGAWFQNCHYPYSGTLTGPGHASIACGCSPQTHGIILNEWFDRTTSSQAYCATLPRYQPVPPRPATTSGASPERLLAPTMADALRQAHGDKSRIVALSLKDRSAVLPGGQHPDACYWWDTGTGQFVTSSYYRDRVHPWVESLNKERPADQWFGRDWQRLVPTLDYAAHSGPDDAPGEGIGIKQGRTFPHPTDGGLANPGKAYYDTVYNSPFGNDLLLALTRRAIDAERLGQRAGIDLLAVSFSSNDPVGHAWGPDSQEVLDITLRSDRIVKELLHHLDARVGRDRYIVVLSADHGVCPLPERTPNGLRLSPAVVKEEAETFLQQTVGGGKPSQRRAVQHQVADAFYLNPAWVRATGLPDADVQRRLADWLSRRPGIQAAYTRSQLAGNLPPGDELAVQVRRSFHPQRSGDVIMVLRPHCLMIPYLTGTSHGTPHDYDTHVPLVVFGAGVRPQARQARVTPQSAAAIVAQALGVPPPASADAAVPDRLWLDK